MRIDILGGMGMETKEKAVQAQVGAAKGKKSRKKVWAVVIGVLLAVIVVAIAFIELRHFAPQGHGGEASRSWPSIPVPRSCGGPARPSRQNGCPNT